VIRSRRTPWIFVLLALVLVGCTLSIDLEQAMLSGVISETSQALQLTTPVPASQDGAGLDDRSGAVQLFSDLSLEQWEALLDAVDAMNVRVYEQVSPSVVHITSRVVARDFWGGGRPSDGTGSGFVIDREGHIVTNYHVIERAETIEVTLLDETMVEAQVVGVDPLSDLAVLRVDVDPDALHPVIMSASGEIKVGQRAIAIGNPFGLDWTMTIGVVSSVGRPLQLSDSRILYGVVQTDAAINPGNSGGPLLNARGELIGVNTAIRRGADNIAFAIPLSTVQRVVPELIANGRYARPWLAISGYSITPELAERLDLPIERGILIVRVQPGGPADRAGLRGAQREVVIGNSRLWVGGDLLVAIDGAPIADNAALAEYLETRTRVGQEVALTLYRDGQEITVQTILQERQQ
jgi:S1-C subfamily serine protease